MSFYGSAAGGDTYFSTRMGAEVWDSATTADKEKALSHATRAVDRLPLIGSKTSDTQTLEFPRGGDATVPTKIVEAIYEEALQLLDGRDIEIERHNDSVVAESFAGFRSTYRLRSEDHLGAGILSTEAWRLISPYVQSSDSLRLDRVS